jgi:glycosyltransferase involved in cell wall biosynthesis
VPQVSVIMPAFNAERYLAVAIDSMLGQTFEDFEIIVVDDGSTDRTADILAACDDPRVRPIRQENRGIAGALNTGLAAASAPLVARMDSDDLSRAERLERQVAFMRSHDDCILLGTGVNIVCPAGLVLFERRCPEDHETISRAVWSGDSQALIHPTIMVRTEAIRKAGGYRVEYSDAEDFDLYLRLLPLGRAANLPEVLLDYRQHFQSTNAVRYQGQLESMRRAITELGASCPYAVRGEAENGSVHDPAAIDRRLLRGWERPTPAEFYRRCGWNALNKGRAGLAQRYAALALRQAPGSRENWRLAVCLLRDRMLRKRGATERSVVSADASGP